MIMIAAGVLHHVTCYDYRFVQSMVCICDVWEEYDERSESAGMEHARIKRHREGQGAEVAMLRAAGDVIMTAEESGKRRGWVSREETQYLAATPQGWFDGPTLGAFLDARRRWELRNCF